jgi:hypothetical protein
MIRLQEIYQDMHDDKPCRIETGQQVIASERMFLRWCKEHNRASFMNETVLHVAVRTLPLLIKDFIMDTGNALRLEDFGIIKTRYHENHLSLLLRNDKRLLAELNDRTCQIDKYIIQDGKKIRFGGRMSEPRNLLLK